MSILTDRVINIVQNTVRKAGITLMKNSRHALEWDLNGALLAEASAAERTNRKLKGKEATGVVFSFNRPVQLQLLLASYFMYAKNPCSLIVQYGAKGEAFETAYKAVAKDFPAVTFVREQGFKDTLMNVLTGLTASRVFFLVDDIVFTRSINMAEFAALDPLQVVPCLRLAPTLRYCYTMQMKQTPPSFKAFGGHEDMLAFTWSEQANEWDYPMSVDGNLFDTAEITVMSRILPFKAPNTYEGALMRFAPVLRKRTGICFAQPKLMNVPCNKVQDEVANKAGDVTPEFLLAKWNEGLAIDPLPFANYPNTSPHQEVGFTFVKRATGKPAAKKGKAA